MGSGAGNDGGTLTMIQVGTRSDNDGVVAMFPHQEFFYFRVISIFYGISYIVDFFRHCSVSY